MMTPPFATTPRITDSALQGSATMTSTTTAVPFELPQGLETEPGQVYRRGWMRLATGEDELIAQQAAAMMDNAAYGILVRLSRVISFTDHPCLSPNALNPDAFGNLFMPDLHSLIELYNTLNPSDYELSLMGESQAIP